MVIVKGKGYHGTRRVEWDTAGRQARGKNVQGTMNAKDLLIKSYGRLLF